jgi:hypothetical protein
MLLFRSVTTGMLGACLYFVLQLRAAPEQPPRSDAPAPGATVVDVAPGVEATAVYSLLALAGDERVVTVDDYEIDQRPYRDLEQIAVQTAARRGGFVDLTIASPAGARRRVLVLMH